MNINDLIFDNNNDNDFEFKSSYPLFNFDALRNSKVDDVPLTLITAQKASEIVEEILYKKVKVSNNTEVTAKKRGRKAVAKNTKAYDDPTITIQEIIENDLVGTPMKSEIKMKEERLKKIQEKKALRKATVEIPAIENSAPAITTVVPAFNLEPVGFDNTAFAPQIIFKDGKIVIDNSALTARDNNREKLAIVENQKPYKLTSMSFRTRNNTAKWTPEETRKFFKGIEIFGADFSLIAKLFPTRNRDQVKNKFNKEEKTNVARMNEAFRKNTTLSKRSIMDRIRAFSNSFETDQPAIAPTDEFDIEIGGIKALERQYSTTSTDSMDLKIIEEIRDIFVNEIRPRNAITAPIFNLNNAITDRPCGFSDPQENNTLKDINQNLPMNEEVAPKKENLLLRLFN